MRLRSTTCLRSFQLAWFVAALQLGGCASTVRNMSGPMSAQAAQAYAQLPPAGFVRQRFYEEELSGVQDGVDSFLDKMMAFQARVGTPNPHQNKPRHYRPAYLEQEGVVVWPAYFTDMNYKQLLRPRGDLQSYCESVTHGRWLLSQAYEQDPIAASMTAPLAAYVGAERDAFAYLERQNNYRGYVPAEAAIAANAAQEVAEIEALRNQRIAAQFSWAGFRAAHARTAFGLFRCEVQGPGSWFVSVLPALFRPMGEDRPSTLLRVALRVYGENEPDVTALHQAAEQNGSAPACASYECR